MTALEDDRLATLAGLDILDTSPEREFDIIVQSARQLIGCKIALVSLVDESWQWFKSKCGIEACETPREFAFCSHAIESDDIMIVTDASRDARFAKNPLVTGEPHIRFYAGAPLRVTSSSAEGGALRVGTLCVIDDQVREMDGAQIKMLRDLAHLVEVLLRVRLSAARARKLAQERGDALQQLDRTHRLFRQAERMANIGSWRLTLKNAALEWSDQTCVIHGVPIGCPPALDEALSFYPAHARPAVEAAVARAIDDGKPFELEMDFVTSCGDYRRVRSMGELEVVNGEPVALVGVFQDITSRHAMEQALRHTAITDELTGLATRGRLNEYLEEALDSTKRCDTPLALLLIDLDHFKDVNDRCGHLAGDDMLRLMAAHLRADYLEGSFAARLGGDEFVLVIRSAAVLADLPGLLRRLLGDMRHSANEDGATAFVSATIGACRYGDGVECVSDLLRRADAALYDAKRAQRGSASIAGEGDLIRAGVSQVHQFRRAR